MYVDAATQWTTSAISSASRRAPERDAVLDLLERALVQLARHLGLGEPGHDEIDGHLLTRKLDREHLRQPGEAGLGGAVRRIPGEPAEADDGPDVHDRPARRRTAAASRHIRNGTARSA